MPDNIFPDASLPETLLTRQREIEEDGISLGQRRFTDRLEKAIKNGTVADSGAAKKLMSLGIEQFSAELEKLIDEETNRPNRRGPRSVHQKWVTKIGARKAAYITLRCAFAAAADLQLMSSVSSDIGKRISDELRFRRLEKEAPELFKYKLSNFATNHYLHRSHSLDQSIRWAEIDCSDLEIPPVEMMQLGAYLIDKLIACTGFFSIQKTNERGKAGNGRIKPMTKTHLVPTPETAKWLADRNTALALMSPVYPPMVVQPLAWGPGSPGGYRYNLRGRNRLVRGATRAHKALLADSSMPAVYHALNTIQNTEWVINQKVLEVFKAVLEIGGAKAGLPSTDSIPEVPRPSNIPLEGELSPEQQEALKRWKRAASRRHAEDLRRSMECMKYVRLRQTADKYKDEKALYFPHNLDFRGRIYPIPTVISPQGDDVQKALLKFAHGKPLGASGVKSLAIHGANAWGKLPDGRKVSKLTLEEREEAVRTHHGAIKAVAEDPIGNSWWMNVDEPWCFLAFCFEWYAAWQDGVPEAFVSSLPVASDGTCNGLQHFAALLRDEVAGEAVNVLDNQRPNDIYQRVADVVLKRLEGAAVDEPLAVLWLDSKLVTRSLTKRPTMTLAYGAKQFGFTEQLMDHVQSEVDWKSRLFDLFSVAVEGKDERTLILHKACVYMARLIWESLGDVVVSAQRGMEWFQKYARAMAKGNQNPWWYVPGTGFVAYQNSVKLKAKQGTKTVLCGNYYQPLVWTETAEIDPVAAANGISPNVIHSLDAAALMLTVNAAAEHGVTSFAMIHDSYGTHAADAWLLNKVLRQAFFQLYQGDVLGQLNEQFQAQVASLPVQKTKSGKEGEPVAIPEPPEVGRLELSRVLQSDYFFC